MFDLRNKVNPRTKIGTTPFIRVFKAVGQMLIILSLGHLEMSQLLLKKGGGDHLNLLSKQRNTPLHLASMNGHLPLMEFLLDKNAEINCQNEKGNTALHLAVDNDHLQVKLSKSNQMFECKNTT